MQHGDLKDLQTNGKRLLRMSENPLNRLTHDQLKLKIEFKYSHEFFCKTMIKQVFLPILYIYKKIELNIDPKKRKREEILEGVNTHD